MARRYVIVDDDAEFEDPGQELFRIAPTGAPPPPPQQQRHGGSVGQNPLIASVESAASASASAPAPAPAPAHASGDLETVSLERAPVAAASSMPLWKRVLRVSLVAAAILLIVVIVSLVPVGALLAPVVQFVRENGPLGVLVFSILYVTLVTCLFPFFIFALVSGYIWGFALGGLIAVTDSWCASMTSFSVCRVLLSRWMWKKLQHNQKFEIMQRILRKKGWKAVIMLRLNWIFPFAFCNYGFGLTQIEFMPYSFASLIGLMPETLFYVFLGSSVAANLDAVLKGDVSGGPVQVVAIVASVVLAIAIGLYFKRLAQKEMEALSKEEARQGTGAPSTL